jgi:hypothetical protein
MKVLKNTMIVAAAIVVAAVLVGASRSSESRPPSVAAERWIAIDEKAGFAVTSDTGTPEIAAVLYLKSDQGWRRARLVTDASAIPLGHQ